jgi:hypothetical protein
MSASNVSACARLFEFMTCTYWGNEKVTEYFNPDAFINCNDFSSFDEVIEYVKEVDNNENLYNKMLNARPVLPDSKLHTFSHRNTEKYLLEIVEKGLLKKPVSQRINFKLYRFFKLYRLSNIVQRSKRKISKCVNRYRKKY